MASLKQIQYRLRQCTERIEKNEKVVSELQQKIQGQSKNDKNYERSVKKLEKHKDKLAEDKIKLVEYQNKMDAANPSSASKENAESEPRTQEVENATVPSSNLIKQMELLAQKVETSLQGVETLVSNQNVIRQQLTEEREIDSKIEEKLQTLTQLCEKHSKTLNHLQESSEIQKRLNDRILVLESQLRETQNKHKKLEQLLKELPTYQELKRVKEELELFKTEAKSTFAEKEKPQLNTYPEDDQFEEENSKEIDFPQSSTLQENVSQEPLKPYGEDPYVEEVKDNHVIVDPIIPEEQESDALPWDSELTELLNAWVENHPHGWSHDEWNHLLGCMAEAGYAEFTQLNYHHEVGAYIESYRLDFISSDD